MSEQVEMVKDRTNQFFATTLANLPMFSAVPYTPDQLRNNATGNVAEGKRYKVSYPQLDGACGLMFMQVWTIDPEIAHITRSWVPFAVNENSDGIEAREILGIEGELYIFMGECDFEVSP